MDKTTDSTLKIGLFGGTFNPVHVGHLRASEEIRERFNLSKVVFIPAHIPPHKKVYIGSEHRLKMVSLAIKDNSFFELSGIEVNRQGNSYSFETIEYFKDYYNNRAEIYFIIGEDAFREIHLWKNYPAFFSLCNFIVMSRPGPDRLTEETIIPDDIISEFSYNNKSRSFIHTSGFSVCFCRISMLQISSTDIRQKLASFKSIRYLVPSEVERYIREHKIY